MQRRPHPIPRASSYTAYTILADDVLVIPVTANEQVHPMTSIWQRRRSASTPQAPLITRDGYRIGALSVTDNKPHADLAIEQRD